MKSPVYFCDLRGRSGKTVPDPVDLLLDRVCLKEKLREKDLVAIKLHFGEKGNTAFVRPAFLKRVVDQVKGLNAKPFLTDTNTLYVGSRAETVSHLMTAFEHGFTTAAVGAPVVIAGGVKGNSAVRIPIDKPIFRTVSIAHDICMADALIVVTHFKGHELCGFGGTLKNLGMGCASREGKLSQHSNIAPKVVGKKCTGCERCVSSCPPQAIAMVPPPRGSRKSHPIASIHPKKCIGCGECILLCPSEAIQIQWNETIPLFQKKMVEYAYGAICKKRGKAVFLNFLIQVTPACDCADYSDPPIVDDIGILASDDPVAIDQAAVDLVNQAVGNRTSKLKKNWAPGEDKFRALYPEVDWTIQLAYGEEIGLGTRDYELIRV